MAKETIGHVDCPACGEQADVREAKSGKAYVMCPSPVCGFQGFARMADSDRALRAKMRPKAPAAAAPGTTDQPKKKGFFDDLIV